jgi:hypothetical protein
MLPVDVPAFAFVEPFHVPLHTDNGDLLLGLLEPNLSDAA